MNHTSTIPNDINLLELMINDGKSQAAIYKPGPYWQAKTENTSKELKYYGLNDFRGRSNNIGTSFCDNQPCDSKSGLGLDSGLKRLYRFVLEKVYPFKNTFRDQLNLTEAYANNVLYYKRQIFEANPITKHLSQNYIIPNSTNGGCVDWCVIDGQKVSMHYLTVLATHDSLKPHVPFDKAHSFFEIGGGFGANVHLLIENYKNLKKFVYLDIPPNLYVGTQYLKSLYGTAVRDYKETRTLKDINFSNTPDLEIICIAPWQIENLRMEIDIFQNSHSFVEMPQEIVQNYAANVERVLSKNQHAIALVSYDGYDPRTTWVPDKLPSFFKGVFAKHEVKSLLPKRVNYHYICATD
jgi:putative sugar O-methyltransferase